MPTSEMLETARFAAKLALNKGAQEAAASAYRSRDVDVQWRDGELERITEATSRGLALSVYVDGRYSQVRTSDLRPEALEHFIADSVALARALAVDPHRHLPDPALYQGQASVDLQLDDAGYDAVTAEGRRAAAKAMEEAARGVKGPGGIISVSSGASDNQAEAFLVHTNGFEGARRTTAFSLWAEVSVKDPDGRKPEDGWYASTRHGAALPSPAEVGTKAAERAMRRVGAKKPPSAVLPMVVDRRAGGRLLGMLLGPMSAQALQQKRSFLDGKVGQAVGSALLDVADDPLIPRGLGSRLWDSEGLAARRFPLFEGGVLRHYYIDDYYGRKLSMAPTTRGMSNLSWKLGVKGQDALVAGVERGVFVTGFLGGNSNATTGDFSLGVEGFLIEKGKLAEPVGELNISGNQLELWKRLVAVGNDPWEYAATRTPTLVFDQVQFAGT